MYDLTTKWKTAFFFFLKDWEIARSGGSYM
jgi:hypothetical protein